MSKRGRELQVRELSKSEQSLVSLLHRLKLIPVPELPPGYFNEDIAPIAFFGNAKILDERRAIHAVAKELGIEVQELDFSKRNSFLEMLLQDPLSRVSAERWLELKALPVSCDEDQVTIVLANPFEREIIQALEFELDRSIRVRIGSERQIVNILSREVNSGESFELEDVLKSSAGPFDVKRPDEGRTDFHSTELEDNPDAAPVVRLVNKIFHDAVMLGASDVHLAPEQDGLSVRARVDGIMMPLFKIPERARDAVVSRIKLVCGLDIAEKRLPQDGRVRLKTHKGVRDLRLSTVPSTYGENVVARILSPESAQLSLPAIGMSDELRARYERALKQACRVNLVTGPTGSGKTSTLYASLLEVRDGKSSIITLEDPIEYRVSGITQVQVNPKIGLSFSQGLRAVLRQDPDIVFVGEIRDSETAQIALNAAQTGHLVLSTLHTNSAPAAVTRLLDLGVQPYVMASSLGFILAQRLVRRLCPECAEPVKSERRGQLEDLGIASGSAMVSKGCPECHQIGFRGRIGVFSFLEVTGEIEQVIYDGGRELDIIQTAGSQGFETLHEAAKDVIAQGISSLEEVERVLGPYPAFTTTPSRKKTSADSGISKRTLLLVEDDEDTRAVFKLLFEREMFEVLEAEDGRKGLELAYQNPPDIIVSDIMMPHMSGTEMLDRLRHDKRFKEVPVLMLTANNTDENELTSLRIGADDFVSKNTETKILLERVHRLLE